MSDLDDLGEHSGDYPKSGRWNAETGVFAISSYNLETGMRELQPLDFGQACTFVIDLLTRQRGFSMYRPGVYDARLTPVGSPPPEWPGDLEFKPAIACWAWNPNFGEIWIETNASLFKNALKAVWEKALTDPRAAEGQQPVIRITGSADVYIKPVNKTFQAPLISIIDFMPRDQVPPWANRPPTVAPPKPPPLLGAQPEIKKVTQAPPARRHKAVRPTDGKPPLDDGIPFGDRPRKKKA
jgi:hypothetical protein